MRILLDKRCKTFDFVSDWGHLGTIDSGRTNRSLSSQYEMLHQTIHPPGTDERHDEDNALKCVEDDEYVDKKP